MVKKTKFRLGELLVQAGLISEEQLNEALEKKDSSQKLGDYLTEQNLITDVQVAELLEEQLGYPHIRLHNYPFDQTLLKLIPKEYVQEKNIVPLKREKNKLFLAISDPLDYFTLNDVRLMTGFEVEPVIVVKDEIRQAILTLYEQEDFTEELEEQFREEAVHDLTMEEASSPIVKILNQLFQQAVVQKASDIHIDPQEMKVFVRLRIDGALRTEQTFSKGVQASMITRVKILAGLDITEQKIPQDGRIKMKIEGRKVDFRVSTLPTIFGEKVVIRVLDTAATSNNLEELGFSEKNYEKFIKMIEEPFGIVLLTGPTGSGKTSTMYAALTRLNDESINIITVEDPVEYQLDGINQIQVNPKVDLTFANGLRAILRQDPDIIMLGEIRDQETANMAVRASITGHLVLSTLHTNDSIGAIDRLKNIGVEQFLIGSSINGVVAQRLVRTVCRECVRVVEPSIREKAIFSKYNIEIEAIKRGAGCPSCNQTGYRGRTAIHEVLYIDDEIREAILNEKTSVHIEQLARQKGFTYLFEDGLHKVKQGLTTTEEVFRVAQE